MALGFSLDPSDHFMPIVKYNAHEGRILRIDRTAQGKRAIDITANFAAIFDMEAIEVGWMQFSRNRRPDMRLFPLGGEWPEAPSLQHKRGLRVLLQLAQSQGGDVRELCSTSNQFLAGFDLLHDEYLAGLAANAGKLPVVSLMEAKPDHPPRFTIAGWVRRPETLSA